MLLAAAARRAAAQRVTIRTDDGVTLAATWYEPASRPGPGGDPRSHAARIPGATGTRSPQRLASEGIGALALDLRGHGESGPATPAAADQSDTPRWCWTSAPRAAISRQRTDVQQTRVGIVGASIGANLAALAAAADATIASLALLSPSRDYRGLRIDAAVRKIGAGRCCWSPSDDDPYASRRRVSCRRTGADRASSLI